MNSFVRRILQFLEDQRGPTAIEYAMLIGLIFLVVLTAITAMGQATSTPFEQSQHSIEEAFEAGS